MLILRPYEPRMLMLVPAREWMPPSQAQAKNCFGHENRVTFRLTAMAHDGAPCWRGWFEDRDDFDAFLLAIVRHQVLGEPVPAPLWRLPTPWWDDSFADLTYEFATTVTHVSPTGSNQTGTSPSDWNNATNAVETLGAGGAGGGMSGTGHGTGAGGGAWNGLGSYLSLGANFTFATPGTTTYTWRVGAKGTGVNGSDGGAGGDSWFNGTTLAGSSCGSKGGSGGKQGTGSRNGGTGGVGSSGVGTSNNDGGRGGNMTGASGSGASGGGGAAGANGVGGNGVDSSSTASNVKTDGGAGDNGSGGAAPGADQPGNNGSEWTGSRGSGSGGGGRTGGTGGRIGGNYGGGGSGNQDSTTGNGGSGADGIVVLTYTPLLKGPLIGGRLTRGRLLRGGTLLGKDRSAA